MTVRDAAHLVDGLLATPPFTLSPQEKRAMLLASMNDAFRWHVSECEPYARFCARRGFGPKSIFERVEDLPFLPVQAFKEFGDALRTGAGGSIKTRLQSSATSGRPSTVLIDSVTARRQVLALTSVLRATLGGQRRPFIVCDVDPVGTPAGALGARAAAVRGFLNLARDSRYVLRGYDDGRLEVIPVLLEQALADLRERDTPFAVFGFTYVLFESVLEPLLAGAAAPPSNGHLLHIGGWKKLEDRRISRERFAEAVQHALGISPDRIVDFYGFTEQMGVVYPAGIDGVRQIPAFADVIVRDPNTYEVVPDGETGLLQFVTPVPHSYPGISILTDDVGVRIETPAGPRFRVLGRARNAEVRGCGDIMASKMIAVAAPSPEARRPDLTPRLLFHEISKLESNDPLQPLTLRDLPKAPIATIAGTLREARVALDSYTFDELAALIGAAAERWATAPHLAPLRHQGLAFLRQWCRPSALARLGDEALKGRRGHLDSFLPFGGHQVRAFPRGLVAHWLSGNVPLLGMLAVSQAVLSRNANLIKCSSTFSSALPVLLDAFRDLTVTTAAGRVLRGDDVLRTIAVVYFPREDEAAAAEMSQAADVRVAWGGAEAITAISRLPRRYDTEDVMFGPKLSFMAIGRELLTDARAVKKVARKAATDASVFDQYACASPHTIFVERGGVVSPREFAAQLAEEMQRASVRIPKAPIDGGTSAKVATLRLQQEFGDGELWTSRGTTWTVLFDESGSEGLCEPCYSRVIRVRALDDILDAAVFASADTQTIGLGLSGERRHQFAEMAAQNGAYRFPDIGRMTEFDTVWDGLYMLDRFVRWVSLGGPAS